MFTFPTLSPVTTFHTAGLKLPPTSQSDGSTFPSYIGARFFLCLHSFSSRRRRRLLLYRHICHRSKVETDFSSLYFLQPSSLVLFTSISFEPFPYMPKYVNRMHKLFSQHRPFSSHVDECFRVKYSNSTLIPLFRRVCWCQVTVMSFPALLCISCWAFFDDSPRIAKCEKLQWSPA